MTITKDRTRYHSIVPSPFGDLDIVVDHNGALTWLGFHGTTAIDDAVVDPARGHHVRRQLDEYFAGRRQSFDLLLAAAGTPFQSEVWLALGAIPYGTTVSYGELARRIGRPHSARAVGRANALNPISIIVPCHRVIGRDGLLTGYSSGLDLKRKLLALEARVVRSGGGRDRDASDVAGRQLAAASMAQW